MMENVFLHLLNMSLTAAVLVVVVLLLRLVFHKAPRWIHCLLWALVAVRLLCPFAIESDLSLMPSAPVVTVPDSLTLSDTVVTPNAPTVDVIYPDTPATPVPPQTNVGGTVTTPVTPIMPDSSVAAPGDSVDPWQVALTVATYAWLLGVLAMLIYAAATTLRLRLQVREAVCVQGNLWQCDHLRSPFILGVLRPRIYLPSDLDSTAQASVIAHEKAHLKRLDHLWKPLGFLLLAVYWFNPVLWVAYIFLCRDIEAACDEQVVRNMTAADRKAYSEALLACSAPRRLVSACPLAFGETSVKSRIKSVLSYKKPTIWIIVAALLVSTVAGVCLLTDRPVAEQEPDVTDKSTYAVFVHSDRPMAQIRLEMDGTHCTYTPSTLSSAMPAEGTYVTEEDRITLTFADPDMILVFKGDFTGLTFCDEDSRYQEEYLTFGGYTLPDGAVFVRRTDNSVSDDTPDTAKTAPVGLTHVAGGLGEWQNETLQAVYGTPPEGSLPIKVFASYDELDAFLSTYATAEGKIQRADFAVFDAAWFADNTLLMSYYTHPSTPAYPKVDSYVYSEDGAGLTVRLHVYVPSFGNDAFSAYHLFSGIRKSDLEGVKNLTAVVAATIPNDYYVAAFSEHTEHPEKAVEKWRRWLPSDEAWALERMLSEWDDAARWGDAQSVDRAFDFATAINLHGHTHYLATDYSALLRDDGTLLWLNEAEGAFLRWIAAYYDEENEEILYLASSHPTSYDRRYAAVPVVLNSPELKAIVNSNRWEEAFGDVSSYGRFTLGGTVYHIDRTRERIVYANENNTALYAVYLTAEELALVDGILASTPWAHTDYMVGKVTQILADEDCVTMKLTDSSKYTSDISDGTEVRVSLRYYAGDTPAVGSTIRVTYDGYLGTFYDGEHYVPLIHAHSVAVTSQPTGTTTTKPTTTKPTVSPTEQVTFVKFSRPSDSPDSYFSYARYMYPVQPDAATCAWLRQLASKTNWVKRDTYSGDYDAYFTIGDDENYYYIDRVNQRLFHNRRFASLTEEELNKLDTLIRSYGIQNNSQSTSTVRDWRYLTGRVEKCVEGQDGYVVLKLDNWWANTYGENMRVSTRFIPYRYFAKGSMVCVVYDGEAEPSAETESATIGPFTIYAGAMNVLEETTIVSTGVPQYDNLLKQIQDYFYKRSDLRPNCSSAVWNCEALSDIGIKLIDLDQNGQDELVIGATNSTFWVGYSDVYTIKDGQLVQLYCSNDNHLYSIHKGGHVCQEWTEDTLKFGEDYYRIEGDKLVYLEGLMFDIHYASSLGYEGVDAWFHVTVQDGKEVYEHITEAESKAIADKYGKNDLLYTLYVIPFSL